MPGRKISFSPLSLSAAACLLCLVSSAALAAGGNKPVPMDAAAATEMPSEGQVPDAASVPPGGNWSTGESGSWSLGAQESREKKERTGSSSAAASAAGAEPAADDPAFHSGYWSSTGNKSTGNPTPPPDATPPTQTGAAGEEASLYEGHSAVVTSVQTCYSQLDPATAAEIQRSYVKPYEECQKRLAEKNERKNYARAGQLQDSLTPETPRNYIRVQNNLTAP